MSQLLGGARAVGVIVILVNSEPGNAHGTEWHAPRPGYRPIEVSRPRNCNVVRAVTGPTATDAGGRHHLVGTKRGGTKSCVIDRKMVPANSPAGWTALDYRRRDEVLRAIASWSRAPNAFWLIRSPL